MIYNFFEDFYLVDLGIDRGKENLGVVAAWSPSFSRMCLDIPDAEVEAAGAPVRWRFGSVDFPRGNVRNWGRTYSTPHHYSRFDFPMGESRWPAA